MPSSDPLDLENKKDIFMRQNISIGLMNSENTKLRSGPKVFMDRLTKEINSLGLLNQNEFDIWLNLSFKKIPNFVLKKKAHCHKI
jgi:hypothetical protein